MNNEFKTIVNEVMASIPVSILLELDARRRAQGDWVPACGGSETPFTSRSGKRLLYVWQPASGNHAYLDLGSDLILSDEQAREALCI